MVVQHVQLTLVLDVERRADRIADLDLTVSEFRRIRFAALYDIVRHVIVIVVESIYM